MFKFLNSKYVVVFFILALLIFFVFQEYQNKKNRDKNKLDCLSNEQDSFKGRVLDAYYDDAMNVKAYVIVFTNGKKYINPIYLKSLNGYVESGDSIEKVPGHFKFIVFKKDKAQPVIIDEQVDCKALK